MTITSLIDPVTDVAVPGRRAEVLAELRSAEERNVRGRPRILYSARDELPGPRSYGLLAEMLTGLVAPLVDAGPAATEAGRAWGRHLVERAAPSERMDADEATTRLNRVLDAIGELQAPVEATSLEPLVSLNLCVARLGATRGGSS
jgi:hypothetical protein